MKKIIIMLLALLLFTKNVYSEENHKNYYMLLPSITSQDGKILNTSKNKEDFKVKFRVIEIIDNFLS